MMISKRFDAYHQVPMVPSTQRWSALVVPPFQVKFVRFFPEHTVNSPREDVRSEAGAHLQRGPTYIYLDEYSLVDISANRIFV